MLPNRLFLKIRRTPLSLPCMLQIFELLGATKEQFFKLHGVPLSALSLILIYRLSFIELGFSY